jgi:anti-sigma factor RsiW
MSCEFEEDLTAYLDRELPPLRHRQLEAHLPSCQGCTDTVALLRRTLEAVASLPAFVPPAQLRRDVLHRISEEPRGWLDRLKAALRLGVLVPALALGAAVLVAVVAVNGLGPDLPAEDDAVDLELAANLELVEDLDVLGLESPEDLEVLQHLDELEGQP